MNNKFETIAIAMLALLAMASRLVAERLQVEVLASFNGPGFNSTNGSAPVAGLTEGRDGKFYGTTYYGGIYDTNLNGDGTVFQVTTNGVLTSLASFDGTNGSQPGARLTLGTDGAFYGTTSRGGSFGYGNVFRVTTDGVLTTLVSFAGTNGAGANALTLGNDGNFYGTTAQGGSGDYGTVFRLTTNGALTTLASVSSIGAYADAPLTLGNDGYFYGTTESGGSFSLGTVFRATSNGVLTKLVSFAFTNGANPIAGLSQGRDGNFYGTTGLGGAYTNQDGLGLGTVFKVTSSGVLTTLVSFDATNGAKPQVGLVLGTDGNFYGTTRNGGNDDPSGGYGTLFQVTTNGVLTPLLLFAGTNGAHPGNLTLGSDGNFYGTTVSGGPGNAGGIFRLRRGVSIPSFGMATSGFQLNTLNVGGSGWVVLESSSDLVHWTPIQTNGTAAAQQFLDPATLTQPRQFYRVRQQ